MNTDRSLDTEPQLSFTLAEVGAVLEISETDPTKRAELIGVFTRFAGDRALAEYQAETNARVVDLAVSYERVEGEGASDSNIEGWQQRLLCQSEILLLNYADREESRPSEYIARNLAAVLYVGLLRQSNDRIDLALLERAGFSETELLELFKGALVNVAAEQKGNDAGIAEIVRLRYPTLQSLTSGVISTIWPSFISPIAADLRASLRAEGNTLPVLNEQGLYPDEVEE
jgi:hypothetical protein